MTMNYAPGVYVEEISLFPPSVAEVATAIPAFIGYTEKSPDGYDPANPTPIRVMNMIEYETYFGGPAPVAFAATADTGGVSITAAPDPDYLLYPSLQMYFNNGGGPCWIVSVGDYTVASKVPLDFTNGINCLEEEDEPTLIVLADATNLPFSEDTDTPPLGDVASDYYTCCQTALAQCGDLKDRFTIVDVVQSHPGVSVTNTRIDLDVAAARKYIGTVSLNFGAAYYPYLRTSIPYPYKESGPDAVQVTIPAGPVDMGDTAFKDEMADSYNALKLMLAGYRYTLPPSGAMAGIYARVDRTRGVWKAPANEGVMSVFGPNIKITEKKQDELNVHTSGKSIDAIRAFIGKGTLVWGARTLAGNDNEWRYISVRRLFNMIEESVQESTEWAVFEANDAMTWLKVKTMIESYLEGLWRRGALAGPTKESAFFVNVGLGTTMTPQDILEGRMIVEIGIAAVRPAEFILLKFSHKMQEA